MKAALPGFSMFVCTLAVAGHKGAHKCIGRERLDLATATATAKYKPRERAILTGACDE